MYICSCFGITDTQIKQHAEAGLGTPRAIAGACKAGTDCGSCVRRIQALLGRTAEPCRVHPEAAAAVRPSSTADVAEAA